MSPGTLRSLALAVALGTLLGLASALVAVRGVALGGDVRNGPWSTSLETGSTEAGLYTRARVAVGGLLALDPRETVYFSTATDEQGTPLHGQCDYRVEGRALAARWWSITAYGPDHFLIPNPADRYSFSKTTLPMDTEERFVVRVSSREKPGAWLPVAAGDSFSLTIRLYNPDPSVYEAPSRTELPRVVIEGCP